MRVWVAKDALNVARGGRHAVQLLMPSLLRDLLLQLRDLHLLLFRLLLAFPYLFDLCNPNRRQPTYPPPAYKTLHYVVASRAHAPRVNGVHTCLKPPVCHDFLFRNASPPPMVAQACGILHQAHTAEHTRTAAPAMQSRKPVTSPTKVTFTARRCNTVDDTPVRVDPSLPHCGAAPALGCVCGGR